MSRTYAITMSRSESDIVTDVIYARQAEEGIGYGEGFTVTLDSREDRVELDEATMALLTQDKSEVVYADGDGSLVVHGAALPIDVIHNA